jgi:hypothetical protein
VPYKSLEGIPLPTVDRRPHRSWDPPLDARKNPFRKRAQSSATLRCKLIFIWDLELAGWRNRLSGWSCCSQNPVRNPACLRFGRSGGGSDRPLNRPRRLWRKRPGESPCGRMAFPP